MSLKPLNKYGFTAYCQKRYVVYDYDNKFITILKYFNHALGHLLDLFSNDSNEKNDWNKDIWYDILNLHYDNTTLERLYEKYQNKYALSKFMASNPRILGRLSEFNKNKDYKNQFKPRNFCIIGFSNVINPNTGKLIKPLTPFVKPSRHAVFSDFVDYNDDSRQKLNGKQYWKLFWDAFLEYLNHPESKFDGGIGILQRKHVRITSIVHIGKESNRLDESELFGLDDSSYEIYHDDSRIDEKFRKIAPKILELKPKDVKKFRISKQTLWNVKEKIKNQQIKKISNRIKICLIQLVC